MPDMSSLDKKYIIDNSVYNCPFCKRNHVSYVLRENVIFDWSNDKKCFVYFLECQSCNKKSMHLSLENIGLEIYTAHGKQFQRFASTTVVGGNPIPEPDSVIFYSVPTSFFTIDSRIPKVIR